MKKILEDLYCKVEKSRGFCRINFTWESFKKFWLLSNTKILFYSHARSVVAGEKKKGLLDRWMIELLCQLCDSAREICCHDPAN